MLRLKSAKEAGAGRDRISRGRHSGAQGRRGGRRPGVPSIASAARTVEEPRVVEQYGDDLPLRHWDVEPQRLGRPAPRDVLFVCEVFASYSISL